MMACLKGLSFAKIKSEKILTVNIQILRTNIENYALKYN